MTIRRVRGLAIAILAGCVVAAAPAAAVGATARAASDPTAMISATPSSNLEDGQSVTVTGTGYPANDETDLVECEQGGGCDFSTLAVQFTDADGNYTTTFTVHRILTLDGTVDCVTSQDCVLVSLDIGGHVGIGAQTAITFDPNGKIQPPLHFRVMPAKTDKVVVDKGVVRLTGTVACNRPADVGADMLLTQVYGRSIFQSEVFVDIPCDHGGHWAAVFRPVNGLFGAGAARVRIDAFGFTTTSYEQIKATALTLVPRAS